jgi:hypothetical protein
MKGSKVGGLTEIEQELPPKCYLRFNEHKGKQDGVEFKKSFKQLKLDFAPSNPEEDKNEEPDKIEKTQFDNIILCHDRKVATH